MLAELVRGQPDSMLVNVASREHVPPQRTHTLMTRSVFCLAPPGDDMQLTTRHLDAILAGCIPVILTRGRVPLQFDNVLDWSAFAVVLQTTSIHDGTLVNTLRSKTANELRRLRENAYAVRPFFAITSEPNVTSGLDMLLHQLAMQ